MLCFLIIFAEMFCRSFGICDSFNFIVDREAFGGVFLTEGFFELFILPGYCYYKGLRK